MEETRPHLSLLETKLEAHRILLSDGRMQTFGRPDGICTTLSQKAHKSQNKKLKRTNIARQGLSTLVLGAGWNNLIRDLIATRQGALVV